MLFPDRHPDLQPDIAGGRIKLLVIALEVRSIRRRHPRRRQPVIPDRVDGAANGRDVLGVGEHRVFLFGNPHAGELARQVGEIGDLDAGDVIEIAGIVAIAADAVGDLPDPVGVLAAMRRLAGDDGAVVVMDERVAETFTAPGDDVERLMYGYSLMCCLADGMAHQPSVGTGTVMRPSTLRRYAVEAGFADVEILDIANDFFRFYRLR